MGFCVIIKKKNNVLFGQKEADETRRHFHLPLWNIYNFFVTYANIDKYAPKLNIKYLTLSILDKWILARLNQTINLVTQSLNHFDAFSASHSIEDFVSDLSLWYVRRSRDRVGPSATDIQDKLACLGTLHLVLSTVSKLLAPFTPFISESIYKNLTDKESVHLSTWPKAKKITPDQIKLIEDMKLVRKIVELGLSQRKTAGFKVRQPLRALHVKSQIQNLEPQLIQLVKDELNVKNITFSAGDELSADLDLNLDPDLIAEGKARELIRQVQDLRKSKAARLDQSITLTLPIDHGLSDQLLDKIKAHSLTTQIRFGSQLEVELI